MYVLIYIFMIFLTFLGMGGGRGQGILQNKSANLNIFTPEVVTLYDRKGE